MAQKTQALLRKAVAQIRDGKLNKARPALVDLLRREPNNEQAWYLLSFALDDPQRQQYALLQAVKINSQFAKARARLAKLRGEPEPLEPPAAAKAFIDTPETEPSPESTRVEAAPEDQLRSVPTFFEEAEDEEKSSDDIEATIGADSSKKPPTRRNFFRGFFIIVLFLVLAVLAFFAVTAIFSSVRQPNPTPTILATQTLPATWTPTTEPTATATPRPTQTSSPSPAPTETLSGSETASP